MKLCEKYCESVFKNLNDKGKGYLYNYKLIKVLLCKCVRMGGKIMFCLGCFENVQELTFKP
jgi:hypothetical protein